jgi:hypothetical protein
MLSQPTATAISQYPFDFESQLHTFCTFKPGDARTDGKHPGMARRILDAARIGRLREKSAPLANDYPSVQLFGQDGA